MIRTIDFGMLPTAKNLSFIGNETIGIVETCDGKVYEVRRAFSGSLVAIEI